MQKARKIAQSVRPRSDKPKEWRSTPQAMIVSTGEKKKKSDGTEYENRLPIPCTPKELDVLMDKWIANGFSNLIKFLETPLKNNGGNRVSAICIIMCNMPLQNAGHSVD